MPDDNLYVTRPSLPPRSSVDALLDEIWESRMLTNGGPILQRFEKALAAYLGVEHISVVANATLGCLLAMRHLDISGEVITPAFSFAATVHAASWIGADIVFADIDPETLNIDPDHVERLITPRTRAILAVHCYATPCDTAALADIAARHGLALIYDSAHCFAARDEGGSLLRHGDFSVLSFHATKVFSTFEGGAIVSKDAQTKQAIDRLANFGIVDENTIDAIGLNAKMSELHAAVGLAQLDHVAENIKRRGAVADRYRDRLKHVQGLQCVCAEALPGHNEYAFPILVGPDYPLSRDALYERLKENLIYARRYFYPLLSDLPMYRDLPSAAVDQLPVAHHVASAILCLPLYPDLSPEDQERILNVICAPCS